MMDIGNESRESSPAHCVVVSLGSNCGDRRANVEAAIGFLKGLLSDIKVSTVYRTPPVGHKGSDYMNAVAAGFTRLDIARLDSLFKAYETEQGRDAEARALNLVPVDLDTVAADGRVLRPRDWSLGFFRRGWEEISQYFEAFQ